MRLIGADGEQIGIKSTDEALKYAWDANLDLVEVAPDAKPPVCRVMDYSKYKYEQEQKAKLARKHQSTITIKEIKLRPKIDPHDYATKKGHVVRFLKNRDKVKVTIMFRGREMTHPDRGRVLLLRLADEVQELGVVESAPLQDGRNMVMMLAPHKNVVTAQVAADGSPIPEQPTHEAQPAPVAAAPATAPESEPAPAAAADPEPEPAVVAPEPVVESAPEAEPTVAVAAAKPAAKPAAKKPATKPAAAKPAAAKSTKKTTTTKSTAKSATASDTETAAKPADGEK